MEEGGERRGKEEEERDLGKKGGGSVGGVNEGEEDEGWR